MHMVILCWSQSQLCVRLVCSCSLRLPACRVVFLTLIVRGAAPELCCRARLNLGMQRRRRMPGP